MMMAQGLMVVVRNNRRRTSTWKKQICWTRVAAAASLMKKARKNISAQVVRECHCHNSGHFVHTSCWLAGWLAGPTTTTIVEEREKIHKKLELSALLPCATRWLCYIEAEICCQNLALKKSARRFVPFSLGNPFFTVFTTPPRLCTMRHMASFSQKE